MLANHTWLVATVGALRDLTPTVREIELVPEQARALNYEPGAHLRVQLLLGAAPQKTTSTRSYSLIGEPDAKCYRIAVKRIDEGRGGSLTMWQLAVGDRLQISTPLNHFHLDSAASAYLIVAGGIGITPLVLMAQRLGKLSEKTGVPLRMLYGARNEQELAYSSTLHTALGEKLELRLGSANIDFAAEIAALPAKAQLYTCGPVPMLEALKRAWAQAGRPQAELRFETFGSGGRYAAESFRVKVPRQRIDITVPKDTSLLEALEIAGVQTLSDCRRGECGLCTMDVLDIEGSIDHRDVFLSEHEKASNQRLCVCVSRAIGEITLDCAYRPEV